MGLPEKMYTEEELRQKVINWCMRNMRSKETKFSDKLRIAMSVLSNIKPATKEEKTEIDTLKDQALEELKKVA